MPTEDGGVNKSVPLLPQAPVSCSSEQPDVLVCAQAGSVWVEPGSPRTEGLACVSWNLTDWKLQEEAWMGVRAWFVKGSAYSEP